ncbi:MAG: flagellar motor switch protein FliN [Pirellulales bacterium]
MTDQPESTGQDDAAKTVAETQEAAASAANAPAATTAADASEATSDEGTIEALLNEAQSALSSIDEPAAPLPAGVEPFEFRDLAGPAAANETANLDLLRDVQLDLKIELGRTHMHLEEVLRLQSGAVVTLDKLAGDPVDIYANGRLIARGEVLVLNDNFCVRVAELIAGDDSND